MQHYRKTLGVIWKTFRGYYKQLSVLTALGVLSALLDGIGINALIPLFSFLWGDSSLGQAGGITETLRSFFAWLHIPFSFRFLLGFIVVLFLVRVIVLIFFTYARARVGANFMYKESSSLFRRMVQAKWPYLIHQKAGYLQNTLYWDVKKCSYLLDGVVQFIQSSSGFAVYIIVAISISPQITIITLTAGGLLLLFLHPFVQRSVRLGEETSVTEKEFINHLSEHIAGLKSVKASGVGIAVFRVGQQLLDRLRSIFTKATVIQMLGGSLIQPFSFIFMVILFGVAYKLPGFNLAAFAATLYLIQKIFMYLQSTQSSLHGIADHIPFAENLLQFKTDLREAEEHTPIAGKPFIFNEKLEFENVSLSYTQEREALSQVSFVLKRGALLGLVGPSGGGKTSIGDIILRLFTPTSGRVSLDGVSIEDISMDAWRKSVGYVSQDIFLMDASVEDNIRFYDSDVTQVDIERAAKQAHIYDDIMRLPEKFKTMLGNRGTSLSYGQRQRIVLARALARKPQLLILDEATSSLDSESERAIKQAIDSLRGTITLFVIAHRLTTIQDADELFVLKEGRIIESGTPHEMFADKHSYLYHIHGLQNSRQEL